MACFDLILAGGTDGGQNHGCRVLDAVQRLRQCLTVAVVQMQVVSGWVLAYQARLRPAFPEAQIQRQAPSGEAQTTDSGDLCDRMATCENPRSSTSEGLLGRLSISVLHRFEYTPWGVRNRVRSRADRIG